MEKKDAKGRNWCFTEHDLPMLLLYGLQVDGLPAGVRYLCCQLERAPDTGKDHLQGYVQLGTQQRLSWLKVNLSQTAHWEVARGTPDENRAYCSKDQTRQDGPWEFGVLKAQGTRSDLLEVKAALGTYPPLPLPPHPLFFEKLRLP